MAQTLGFFYTLFLIISNFQKTAKKILIFQTLSFLFKSIHYLLLGGLSGFWSSNISMIRNIIFSKIKRNKKLTYFFIILYFILGIITYKDLGSILPMCASIYYTIIVNTNNPKYLRKGMIINCLIWLLYNIYIISYAGITTQIVMIISTIISIKKLDKNKNINYNTKRGEADDKR